jgi:hypothetical protein
MTPYPKDVAPSDETLMLVFSQGSSEAFTELFHRYKQPLYAFFHRRLGEPAQAEELTQETFLALMNAATRSSPEPTLPTEIPAHWTPRNTAAGYAMPWRNWKPPSANLDVAGIRTVELCRNLRPIADPTEYRAVPAIPRAISSESPTWGSITTNSFRTGAVA